jgi:SAM-dependent methyltransferase
MDGVVDDVVMLNREQEVSETDPFTERRYRQFVRHFSRHTKDVLDIGCNTGRGGAVMKALRPKLHITGVDCVPERVASLDPLHYDGKICGFTHDMPLASGSVDAIVAGEFLEHLPPDLVFATLCQFFRVLRLRGLLLLTTPNPRYLRHFCEGTSVLGGAHISQHYIGCLKRRLMDVGFSSIKVRGSGRVSIALGERFPIRAVYGSYLVKATKW